ncbi:helix-turn-helix transcriptional regulator [Candidatus Poribacteria bacterium]|nr:helix-turn-helix transcriptional regulator [Candidatus Poribacteria bacterium]
MNSIFGIKNEKLERARRKANLSRRDVATELGLLDSTSIRDWEWGLFVPEKHRKKLIELYGLDKKYDC